ncbi:glucohydrolase [Enterococcus sp. BWB1-3]|uniref:alpha-amylase family glycosyl hydrolase n=1 Tax=unclassified Enterococcus TaxID=2608891 RepID=UPI00192510B5|nr:MULTISPECIES: alpha-amylase family glycosyl hydrolase [unclassified Enterococcus]MBL1229493.1 glucohydrolase [Enterococcus sp. BWB1-3]MCB5952667.1 glucohydrolase [Enterococcus sp. BWT-B8]MCB5955836.1 glucohydrolase [Enterococcus sp. CWB-B31]
MWWEKAVFYEIYLPSFADGNGDGIGDFLGIREKLPYLKNLGVDCIWLTPFYPSPKIDNGYDVADYCGVDEQYGTLDDLQFLISEAHQMGIRIIIDVVFNHTSTEHPWFVEAAKDRTSLKRDWYIWRDVPNNWESFFGGSAWNFDSCTNQYYYHSFAKEQADLNWRNPEVKTAIFQVLDFWLHKGIDGFRFDVINNLSASADFPDNPNDSTGNQLHKFDVDQEGTKKILKEINQFVKSYNSELFTVAEISSDELMKISSYVGGELFDTAFNFDLGSQDSFDLEKIKKAFEAINSLYMDSLPTLFFNSHDMSRSWNRLVQEDKELYKLLAVFVLINRGIPFLYQGEELGIGDFIPAQIEDIRDIQAKNKYQEMLESMTEEAALKEANKVNRDRSRGMMLWNDAPNNWIGKCSENEDSLELAEWYRSLIQLRYQEGPFNRITAIFLDEKCLSYRVDDILVVLNFDDREYELTIEGKLQILFGAELINKTNKRYRILAKACWIGRVE